MHAAKLGMPLVFVQSTRDAYGAVADLQALFDTLSEPKQLLLVDAQDHFFAGSLDQLEEAVAGLT